LNDVRLQLTMPQELKDRIYAAAKKNHLSVNAFIRLILYKALAGEKIHI